MTTVLRLVDGVRPSVERLLRRFGIALHTVPIDAEITGSFWGAPEAGIVGMTVFARDDTPVHSILHEAGHIVCMSGDRRRDLNRDAGGGDLEEAAVCYLQILLGDDIAGVGRGRVMDDMDTWGYSFRLGSAGEWFSRDADDARVWLVDHGLIDADCRPTWTLRQ